MPKVLIAAFTPEAEASGDVAAELARKAADVDSGSLQIEALELPRLWLEAFPALERRLGQDWDAILLVSGADIGSVAVERLALNECDGREKDAEGRRPFGKSIVEGGEAGYWTGLPYRELVIRLSEQGIPSYASHNPGGGVPNLVFYRLMERIVGEASTMIGGLIQLPFLDSLRYMDKVDPDRALIQVSQSIFDVLKSSDRLAFDPNRLKRFKGSPTP